jgi:methionine-rich copper-binding protein CopC
MMSHSKVTYSLFAFRKLSPLFYVFLSLLASFLSIYPELARAHAEYERSDPPANAVIPEPPSEVHVWFTQELFRREGANTLEVFGPDGAQVDQGDARIDDDDRAHMLVSLQPDLPAGLYTVRWRTLSAEDGDDDNGEFSFTVDPEAAQVTPEVASTATTPPASPTPAPVTPGPTAAPTSSSQPGGGLPCFSGVLSFLVVAVIGLRRRKRGPV